jgi:hypothetical protein
MYYDLATPEAGLILGIRMLKLLTLSLILAFAWAAEAQGDTENTAQVEQSEPEPAPNPRKRVCKKVKTTSSHIPQKVCMRQREWDELLRQSQETMDQVHNATQSSSN